MGAPVAPDGKIDGDSDGTPVGVELGEAEGKLDGESDGFVLGNALGLSEGGRTARTNAWLVRRQATGRSCW